MVSVYIQVTECDFPPVDSRGTLGADLHLSKEQEEVAEEMFLWAVPDL